MVIEAARAYSYPTNVKQSPNVIIEEHLIEGSLKAVLTASRIILLHHLYSFGKMPPVD